MSDEIKFKQIISDAAELFYQYGIRSLSMDDISSHLGISKKTLYTFVENKADLIEAILAESRENVRGLMRSVESQGLNAIDELLEISAIVHSYHKSMNSSMQFDLRKYYPEIFMQCNQNKMKAIEAFVIRNLEKGIREGLYRTDLDVGLVANLYIRKMEDIQEPGMLEEKPIPYEMIFKAMFENHIRGISNATGIEYFEKQNSTYKNQR